MSVIILLIIFSVIVATAFLVAFIWAVKSGQYDDTKSPSVRMLFDDDGSKKENKKIDNKNIE
jgi:cbb3-type cytochrome oxidase maturation protein